MKKVVFYTLVSASLIFAISCTKENEGQNNNQSGDSEVTVDGRLSGVFSVSPTKKVRFSQGNLRYNAAENVWRFADKQYEYVGENNERIAANYSGWIDMFGWGTSGWASGANCYEPWSTSKNTEDYLVGGDCANDLSGTYAKADWGVFNTIANSDDDLHWRTLTENEWTVVLGEGSLYVESLPIRENKASLGTITIGDNNYIGLILVPDEWVTPAGCSFNGNGTGNATRNMYNEEQWKKMEDAGAVFLPCAGTRSAGLVSKVGVEGNYWTSSGSHSRMNGIYCAYAWGFDNHSLSGSTSARGLGNSVRLVTENL